MNIWKPGTKMHRYHEVLKDKVQIYSVSPLVDGIKPEKKKKQKR